MPVTTPEAVIWMFVPGVRLSPVLVHWTAPVTETVVGRLVLLIPTADALGDSEESPMLLARSARTNTATSRRFDKIQPAIDFLAPL